MDIRPFLPCLESSYESFTAGPEVAHKLLLGALLLTTDYWAGLAINWLKNGAPMDEEIAQALTEFAQNRANSLHLEHQALALAKRWDRGGA
jgi:hypothetical protein